MEVLDLIQSAAFKAGIIPSFNPDELPGDIIEAGRGALVSQILPGLNCDRTIDITVTSRVYQPKDGLIVLKPFRQPNENFEIIGYSKYSTEKLQSPRIWGDEVRRLRPNWTSLESDGSIIRNNSKWPTNDMNEFRTLAIWSSDMRLVYADRIAYNAPSWLANVMPDVNIDFPPMRIDAVLEESSRIPYEYVYRDEFERILKVALPGVYTTEEYDDRICILVNGTIEPKRLVLPVPLQIINRDHRHSGTIHAPEKFRAYLIDCIAVSLAVTYGVSTVQEMKAEASKSYNLIKKNKTQPQHKVNTSELVCDTLQRGISGRRFYGHF